MYFADSLGPKRCSFFKQQYEHMIPELLQFHPGVCGFYTIDAGFNLFQFPQEETTGVHDVDVLPIISTYM